MERSERGDVIVLSRGAERMLVGARGCHVLTAHDRPRSTSVSSSRPLPVRRHAANAD